MEEIQYFRLPSATNIYGLTTFEHAGKLKILVATRLELYIVEAVEAYGGVKFRSFPFPTPHNSQILAIDSFTRGPQKAPTITVVVASPEGKALLIAYGLSSTASVPLITLSNDSCTIPLDFMPLSLSHTTLYDEQGDDQEVVLVSGYDNKMHLFQQTSEPGALAECEPGLRDSMLPEFAEPPGPPLCVDIWQAPGIRVTAYGCHSGQVCLSITNEAGTTHEEAVLEGPISTVKIFSPRSSRQCRSIGADEECMHPEVLKLHKNMEQAASSEHPPPSSPTSSSSSSVSSVTLSTSDSFTLPSDAGGDPAAPSSSSSSSQPSFSFSSSSASPLDDVHLVVGGASGYAIVYHSIIKNGLNQPVQLEQSEAFDSVLSCEVTDIDWDGCLEILITTFSQELLVYKLTPPPSSPPPQQARKTGRSLSHFLSTESRARSLSQRLQMQLGGGGSGSGSGMLGKRNLSHPNLSSSDPSLSTIDEETASSSSAAAMADMMTSTPTSRSLTFSSFETIPEAEEPLEDDDDEEEEQQEQAGRQRGPEYRLAWRHSYPEPIFCVRAVDVTNDGINEIVVSSLHGLHISQLDWNKGRIDVVQRLDLLKQIRLLERDLARLSPQMDE